MWNKKPTSIEKYLGSDEYIISVDESGTINKTVGEKDDFFTLAAVIIKKEDFDGILNDVNELKDKYWKNGKYRGKKVVLHGREIRKKFRPFSDMQINTSEFRLDIEKLLEKLDFRVICVHLDKNAHFERYKFPDDIYKLCTMYLMERITLPLNRANKSAVIMMESRGKNEDNDTLNKVKHLMEYGNRYLPASVFSNISGVYFDKQRSKCGKKSYWQLELSDLVAYNLHRHLVYGDNTNLYEIINGKFAMTKGSKTGLKIV